MEKLSIDTALLAVPRPDRVCFTRSGAIYNSIIFWGWRPYLLVDIFHGFFKCIVKEHYVALVLGVSLNQSASWVNVLFCTNTFVYLSLYK